MTRQPRCRLILVYHVSIFPLTGIQQHVSVDSTCSLFFRIGNKICLKRGFVEYSVFIGHLLSFGIDGKNRHIFVKFQMKIKLT